MLESHLGSVSSFAFLCDATEGYPKPGSKKNNYCEPGLQIKKLKFKVPLPCLDSRCGIKVGHQTLSPWQTGQSRPSLGGFEAALASCTLSKRGAGIYESYHLSFQSYEAYQADKYHKDKNPSVRWDVFESSNH